MTGTGPQDWSVAAWALDATRLDQVLLDRLDEPARQAWRATAEQVRRDPGRLARVFPAAGRSVGRAPLRADDPAGLLGSVDDLARTLLLRAATDPAGAPGSPAPADPAELYRDGDAAERRAVLRALPHVPTQQHLELVEDALRSNDTRHVAAALGPAADVLGPEAWRQGVLKCLFVGIPLRCVHRLAERADDTLAVMAAGFVAERVAAGRDVPADIPLVLPPGSAALARAGLEDSGQGDHPDRLAAAARARDLLGHRPTAPCPQEG